MTISGLSWETAQLDMFQARSRAFGARLFAAGAWDVLLAIAEQQLAGGATREQITARINTSPESLERWLRVLENAALVRSGLTERGDLRSYLTARAHDGLANLAEHKPLCGLPDGEKFNIPDCRTWPTEQAFRCPSS